MGQCENKLFYYCVDSPHTGGQSYGNVTHIPTACITKEDASLLWRLQADGIKKI